jgi:uncharacterized protein YjbJ (UPF0337 family)
MKEFIAVLFPELRPEGGVFSSEFQPHEEHTMDKDRINGAANQAKGAVKEAAGKVTGDAKLQTEGKADKIKGKAQNAIGGIKDAARDALRDADRDANR